MRHGREFSFVQVMRLARLFLGQHSLEENRVRIRPDLSLSFPPSDVAGVEETADPGYRITASFLGLYGPASPLPAFYTEELFDEASADSSVSRDFLDIIHQRLYLLWFKCWSRYRLFIRVAEERNPEDLRRLLCLIGLGEKEQQTAVPESFRLLRYAGLFSQFPRSASGLETLLRDSLGIGCIRVIQCVRRMAAIPEEQRMNLGHRGRLGVDSVLGSEVADRMGKCRLRIGPLGIGEFNGFLPNAALHRELAALTRLYLTDPLEIDLELILAAGEAPPLCLGAAAGARLGWNTWSYAGEGLGEVRVLFHLATPSFQNQTPSDMDISTKEGSSTLTDYYQRETASLRSLVEEFTRVHPGLTAVVRDDPSVERLLEGTAFLCALLQMKLDDDIPEIIHEVLDAVQPDALRPIPASTIMAFSPTAEHNPPLLIRAGAEIASIPVQGTTCRFRTCFDVTVHPLVLLDASYSQPSGGPPCITLQFELNGTGLAGSKPGPLRLFLADDYPTACDLYLLLTRCLDRIHVVSHDSGAGIEIPTGKLKPAGFAEGEAILARECSSAPGNDVIQEYFLFHDKFLFLDLYGLEQCETLGASERFEIRFELTECPLVTPRVTGKSFVLSAAPAFNLFRQEAGPLSITPGPSRRMVRPAGSPSTHYRIYSVDSVTGLDKRDTASIRYDTHNPLRRHSKNGRICHLTQSETPMGDGFDTFVSIPRSVEAARTSRVKLDMDLACTNGTLPEQLDIGDIRLPTPAIPETVVPRNCKPVTAALFPDSRRNRKWRLLSGLMLNPGSLNNVESFRAILRLFVHSNTRDRASVMENQRKIDAVAFIEAKPADRLIGRYVCRGYDVCLKLRGDGFAGPGDLYLFSAVLERFLAGIVTNSSFTRLVVEEIGKGYRFEWPARMGDRGVL